MSFYKRLRAPKPESTKELASLCSIRFVSELSNSGDAIEGAELTFRIASGQEYSVLFANGQRNLNRKIERFLAPGCGKFGKERYKKPNWATYTGTEEVIADEKGLTIPEMIVDALCYDAKQRGNFDPCDLTVHKMFGTFENGKMVSTAWATSYACFIYVNEQGEELSPAFGNSLQELKVRAQGSVSAKESLKARLAARVDPKEASK